MNPADTGSVRSPLEKPLSELTEEDIAQLTREDCRRFLKQKGMRRPSWNKSQAIQQVICLKALLEDRPDSAVHKNHSSPVPSPQVLIPSPRADPSPYRRRVPNSNPILPPAPLTCASPAAPFTEEHQFASPSPRDEPSPMTIFYDGRVIVYNKVTVEKARAIMHLAASRMDLNDPPSEAVHTNPAAPPPTDPAGYGPPDCPRGREGEDYPGGSTGREASLQRYREKRKDRYKGKRIIGGSPSSMEMIVLGQKLRGQAPNEQSPLSNASSPTQPMPPCTPTRCSSIENQAQKFRILVDLNEDGGDN